VFSFSFIRICSYIHSWITNANISRISLPKVHANVSFRSHVLTSTFVFVITQQHKTQNKTLCHWIALAHLCVWERSEQNHQQLAAARSRLWNMKLSVLAEIYWSWVHKFLHTLYTAVYPRFFCWLGCYEYVCGVHIQQYHVHTLYITYYFQEKVLPPETTWKIKIRKYSVWKLSLKCNAGN